MKSAENLYLIATLLLFLVLPFQNCTVSPLTQQADIRWSDSDPAFRTEFKPAAESTDESAAFAKHSARKFPKLTQ